MRCTRILLAAVLIAGVLAAGCSRKEEVSFKQDIYPILETHCVSCHSEGGDGYVKSGLDLTSYSGLMKGTKFGPIVIAGDSTSSTLIRLLKHETDHSIAMPLQQIPLPEEHIEKFKAWIDAGAKDN